MSRLFISVYDTASSTPRAAGLPRRIGWGLLIIVAILVALITALPIILLFFVTAVPIWLSALIALADVGIIYGMLRFARTPLLIGAGLIGMIGIAALAVVLSQTMATTPPITDGDGRMIPGSIASLEQVELNGSQQWVSIRGHNPDLPVLLFLAGGPGGSELAMTRRYLSALEEYFVIVNWDQPGVGKSYNAIPQDQLTPERFIADGQALSHYLRERFGQEKIYLFGESWGSILGVWLVQRDPDLYHALVTTGQMVAPVQNDIEMYEFAIQLLAEQGRSEDVERLRRNGPPPYTRDELIGSFNAMNGVINNYMDAHAHGEGTGHNLMFDSLSAPEYGLLDKVYWALSLLNTFPQVYAQLNEVDFRTQATALEVPVYFIRGRWDMNSSNPLTEEYFALLDAPRKELIWFEDSAHTPSWDAPARFVNVMINTVLAQTAKP